MILQYDTNVKHAILSFSAIQLATLLIASIDDLRSSPHKPFG